MKEINSQLNQRLNNMIKRILITLLMFGLTSCESWISKEVKKTQKSDIASDRINSGANNNREILKELD